MPLLCGGMGTCGQCRVLYRGEEVLACVTELMEGDNLKDITLLWNAEDDIQAESVPVSTGEAVSSYKYRLAIDIGTTTIAIAVTAGDVIDANTCVNHARSFGADVISRIKHCIEGEGDKIRSLMLDDINSLIDSMLFRHQISHESIEHITIVGNTSMIHMLLGLDCSGLGKYPFTPVSLGDISTNAGDALNRADMACSVYIMPSVSTYVGGDIVAGIKALKMDESDKVNMLIDLGTNGEMVIGDKNRMIVASAAAGPAFEGGNISCGVASIPGAIEAVRIGKICSVKTIGDKTPIGICGSGILSAISEMRRVGIIDSDGLLVDEYFETGYPLIGNIRITQDDIRQFQMAKSAIRTGIEILIENYNINIEEIDTVYLAGGMGNAIDIDAAINVGLLPDELRERVKPVGNTALQGAILYDEDNDYQSMIIRCKECVLANYVDFDDRYMDYMSLM